MNTIVFKIFVSKLFFLIFAIKMVLSVAPLFVSIDKETANAIILQLELENETKETTKDTSKKSADNNYIYDFASVKFAGLAYNLKYYTKSRNYINSFYPSVLTPPPNFT